MTDTYLKQLNDRRRRLKGGDELEEKTKLQIWLFRDHITTERVTNVIGAKTTKTARDKLYKRRDFTLPEMKAIQTELYPDHTLEDLVEGD